MVAHALLLAARRLRCVTLRPVGWSAVHHRAWFPLSVMLLLLMLMVPVIVPALVPLFGLMAIRRLLSCGMSRLRA
jgi:hypothetical protein